MVARRAHAPDLAAPDRVPPRASEVSQQAGGADPIGLYMAGFLLNKTAAEASAIAQQQRDLAALDGDDDDCRWWDQVLAYLAVTGRLKETRRRGAPSRSSREEM
jgi:hypothetical protein